MRLDTVLRVAIWLVGISSPRPDSEAFTGDLLELFAAGRSHWWCLAQALRRTIGLIEQRLRSLLVPFWYCIAFVFLHPLWQWLYAPSVAGLLTRYRGAMQWPGSAVLEIIAGLLPAILFVWAGIFVYALLRRQSLTIHPVSASLSLNVGVCLLFLAMMVRLNAVHHDLRFLSQTEFFYTQIHVHFSLPLFLSLFGAVSILPRTRLSNGRGHDLIHPSKRRRWMNVARILGFMASVTQRMAVWIVRPQLAALLLSLGLMVMAWPLAAGAQEATSRLMAADGKPVEFEVVSVKPNHSGAVLTSIISPPMSNGVTITNMPPENILQWAFDIFLSDQISGLPGWARQERYDVTGKVGDADLEAFRKVIDPIQRAPMLQKVMVERFNLKFHYEMKDLLVYTLSVAKNGIRMTEIQPAVGPNGMKDGGGREVRRGQIRSMGQPMKPLVNQLTKELGRLVVDRTGLTGYYDFTLRWTPEEANPPSGNGSEADSAPSIFTALQEQLGLKLERTKAPVQVLVIDHLERPSAN